MKPITLITAVCLAVACSQASAQSYTLDQLLSLALQGNRGVAASAAQVEAARAGVTSAGAYPNPEIEYTAGRVGARVPGVMTGNGQTISLTQRVDLPNQRYLRQEMARRTLDVSTAGQTQFAAELIAKVKHGYYETLRREAEFQAALEDMQLTQQLYDRAQVRVEVGEAPKYESIRVAAELLNAQKNSQSTLLRANQAKSTLRQYVGRDLPPTFSVAGKMNEIPPLAPLEQLRQQMLDKNPELRQSRLQLQRAGIAVDYQRSLRMPSLALRATSSSDPENRNTQFGVVMSVPLWDQNRGPINEASANAMRLRYELEAREFELAQHLDTAYQQYQIAASQVEALESGIVRQAESALRVAEAAYRYGERGIIDYLDAQRVLRVARNDLIAAQFDLQIAVIEIERLLANPTTGNTP
ncbi:TolC family protein [uncultured Oxalicibacterium sp.]|uniref:TolC family protein n=1 Tax=uncultured Oxalicibacterium sp. TaxID=1168540 RepID=UPI0025D1E56D|nr:TolC family protein [uncultured Oxalicibacterium sp.]